MATRNPVARTEELNVEEIDDEVLVYDHRRDHAHCLCSAAARVWRACDGTRTVKQLSVALALEEGTVARALEELGQCGLLDEAPRGELTRREATTKLARVGAAAASAPLIYSIVAPTPALAQSQAFCNTLGKCVGNCGNACKQAGCSCCVGGAIKLCTADCSAANCQNAIFAACGVTMNACNRIFFA